MRRLLAVAGALLQSDALVPLATAAVGAGLAYLAGHHSRLVAEAQSLTGAIEKAQKRLGELGAQLAEAEARLDVVDAVVVEP